MNTPDTNKLWQDLIELSSRIIPLQDELHQLNRLREQTLENIYTAIREVAAFAFKEFNNTSRIRIQLEKYQAVALQHTPNTVTLRIKIFGPHGEYNEELTSANELYDLVTVPLKSIFDRIIAPTLAVTLAGVTVPPSYFIK